MSLDHDNELDLLYELGLALIELLDRPITVELERAAAAHALALEGVLLRAFDGTARAHLPTLTIMIGGHCVKLRLGTIKQTHLERDRKRPGAPLQSAHILLSDGYALHIKAGQADQP